MFPLQCVRPHRPLVLFHCSSLHLPDFHCCTANANFLLQNWFIVLLPLVQICIWHIIAVVKLSCDAYQLAIKEKKNALPVT